MNGWTKYYADGRTYIGTDQDVQAGTASWRKSPQRGMIAASMQHGNCCVRINGMGTFWQSDGYESSYPGTTKLIKRSIMKQIAPGDKFYRMARSDYRLEITFNGELANGKFIKVPQSYQGKWLVAEIDLLINKVKIFISDIRV